MISITTPTNRPDHIMDLYKSIQAQSYTDWEWVVLANGGARVEIKDPRVRVIDYSPKTDSIGQLKKAACSEAKGDILVEVDHDDIITPNCLAEVAEAFSDQEVGFAYSDNAKLTDTFKPYNPAFGWTHEKFPWEGKEYYRMLSFPPSAASFSFIWYMPDHVRAWRRSVYDKVGGHDPTLDVLDDQDLMARTYLETKVQHIPKCLYLYRISGENTWLKKNKLIQERTVELQKKYMFRVVERWADLMGLAKYDLGGAYDKPEGYLSIDRDGGDIVADMNKGIPLPDNSAGVIRAHDFLEHIADKQMIMGEIWRVLADGGWLMSMTPSTDGRGAFQDPTHVSYWNDNAFWYWTRQTQAKYIKNTKVRFQEFRLETVFPSDYCRQNNIPYTIAWLSAIKSDVRRPHSVKI
jgi:glycosyltransferase involved in cell wall biosynthesis